uniref:Uncharacterized protein n=1 Tax=Arundo donax TaxID=35708 RepID=A0A0A9FSU6_ARUDO
MSINRVRSSSASNIEVSKLVEVN